MSQIIENADPDKKYEEQVLLIKRVTKKTTGGNAMSFSALVVVGDKISQVGIGLGRAKEVPPAIKKAIVHAKRNMITIPLSKSTIPHDIQFKYKAAKILLKPAPEGTGLKVGSVVRAILEFGGVKDVSGKVMGSRNQIVNAYAVMLALSKLNARVVKVKK